MTSTTNTDPTLVITPSGMLSFPHFFTPKPRAENGEAVYSGVLIFDENAQKSEGYKRVRAAVMAAIREKWPSKADDANFVKSLALPFRNGAEKSQYTGYGEGKVFISAWTKFQPGIIDRNDQDITVASDVWSGQMARFEVKAFAWEKSGKKGVSFALNHVQITKQNMPRIDGRSTAKGAFGKVAIDVADDEMMDEAPF